MTLDELTNECWAAMPPIRKHLAGKHAVKMIVADSLCEIDPEEVSKCRSGKEIVNYEGVILDRIKRKNSLYGKEGFVVLSFLLVTIAAAVISWLIQRWLDNRFPKSELESLREEVMRS